MNSERDGDVGMDAGTEARRRLLAGLPVSERRLQLAGISTAVLEGGAGPPLVLLHGPGAYAASWLRVIPELTTSHRVVAPDLPGHGASNVGDGALDAARVLEWLGELVERTCDGPPVVVGQLVSGAIAARFAAAHPDRVERLVLVVPNGLAPFEPSPEFGAALGGYLAAPTAQSHDELWERCVNDLDALQREPAARWDLIKAYNLDLARTPGAFGALQTLLHEFGAPALPEEVLTGIDVPTDLIWGRYDSIVPLRIGTSASARLGWPLHVIEDAGNEPALEAPDAFLAALRTAVAAPTRARVAR